MLICIYTCICICMYIYTHLCMHAHTTQGQITHSCIHAHTTQGRIHGGDAAIVLVISANGPIMMPLLVLIARTDSGHCCSVLQCVAVCCSVSQCVAACCSVLQQVYIYVHFFCSECYMHFTGVVDTSAWAGVCVTQVCFYTNVHICDTLAAGCAHMCICI